MLDRPVERGDPFKPAAPVLQMASRPQRPGFPVAPLDRIEQMAMRFHQPGAAFGDVADDHLGGRKEQQCRRFARELQHTILRRLGD